MEWLSIFFTILEVIGIILIFILSVLFFLIIVVLFGGIRYYVFAEKKEDISIEIKVSFVRIVKFVFLIDNNVNKSYIQILFFRFFKKGFFKTSTSKVNYEEKNNFESDRNILSEKENNEKSKKKENISYKENFTEEYIKKDILKKEQYFKSKKKCYGKKKMNNFFSTVKNIYIKFMYLKNYPEKDKIVKYTLRFIKELFLAVKPKSFQVDLLIGFDDPASTGKFLGFIAVISEFIPFDIYLKGDFDNEVFQGNLKTKGKTKIFKVIIPVLKYIFKPPIWRLIKNRKG